MIRRTIRTTAFLRRELMEIWRQPKLLLTLVVGPFLILGIFGAGLRDRDPPVDYLVTGPEAGPLRDLAERVVRILPSQLRFAGYVPSTDAALESLRRDEVDLVLSLPEDPVTSVVAGRRATIVIYHDVVDPIETKAVELASQQAGDRINRLLSRQLVERGQNVVLDARREIDQLRAAVADLEEAPADGEEAARAAVQREVAELSLALGPAPALLDVLEPEGRSVAGAVGRLERAAHEEAGSGPAAAEAARLEAAVDDVDATLRRFEALPSEVIVNPFVGVARRVGPGGVGLTAFYAPAVIVVLVQHMLISFLTLSLVRERELGTDDLFRIAPLTAGEILAGKYLAYLVLGAITSVALVTLLVVGLDVPLRGSPAQLALGALATFVAAVALGFTLALMADSNSQAVQLAMLVLLASIFFSGFILSLARFHPALAVVSRMLPATYGVSLFRDVMLRARSPAALDLWGLAAFAVVLTAVNWLLLRRRLNPA